MFFLSFFLFPLSIKYELDMTKMWIRFLSVTIAYALHLDMSGCNILVVVLIKLMKSEQKTVNCIVVNLNFIIKIS